MRGSCGIIGVIYYIIFLTEFPGVVELCLSDSSGCVACNGNYQIARFSSGSAADVHMYKKNHSQKRTTWTSFLFNMWEIPLENILDFSILSDMPVFFSGKFTSNNLKFTSKLKIIPPLVISWIFFIMVTSVTLPPYDIVSWGNFLYLIWFQGNAPILILCCNFAAVECKFSNYAWKLGYQLE